MPWRPHPGHFGLTFAQWKELAMRLSHAVCQTIFLRLWINDFPLLFRLDRCGPPARLSAAAQHPRLSDSVGGLQPGADAAHLPAMRPSGQGQSGEPAQSSLHSLELVDIVLPLLLVYCG